MNLTERFKKVDNCTIWNLLDKLSEEPDVFSSHSVQLTPFIDEAYVYIHEMDMVIVYIDRHIAGQSVLADEEIIDGRSPMYFTENSHWTSPVYLLQLASHGIREVLRKLDMREPTIHGVCLTNTDIMNKETMLVLWDWLDITVIDNVDINVDIKVSEKMGTSGDILLMNYMTHKYMADWKLDSKYDRIAEDCPVVFMHESDTVEEDEINIVPDVTSLKGVQVINPIRNPRKMLDQLIGLDDVKQRIFELTMFTMYNNRLRASGGKIHQISLHGIFYGNPGTGKTTVGRLYASLLLEAGALSKGHVVLVNGRQAFIGRLFGDEETAVENIVKLAEGGLLFIDEAYTLMGNHSEDPGKQVLPMLMQTLADEKHRDIAIIVAGYQRPLEELLALNCGLDSRFPQSNRFYFPDYSPRELFQIAIRRIYEYGYSITNDAKERLMAIISDDYAIRDTNAFGNGRYVMNRVEEIFIQHGIRCIKDDIMDINELHCIVKDDIISIQKKSLGKRNKKIGFAI